MKRVFILAVFCVLAGRGFAQSDLQPAAIVNLTKSEPITVKQLRTEVERMEKSAGRTMSADERKRILDVMINERLALQAAERERVTISESEINQQIQQMRSSMGQTIGHQPTETEFTTALRNETGLDMPGFREQLRRELIVQKYLMAKKEANFKAIKIPTEEEIRNTYNLTRSRFVRPDTVRFTMIQVPFTDAASKTRAKQLADRLLREIGTNATKFDEAVTKGQAPNSGYKAGEGGYLPRNLEAQQVVGEDFIKAAFSLRQGQVSRLIENKVGYHIIKVTEIYTMSNLGLDDIFQLGTRMTVRDFIGNALLQERQQEAFAKASQELVTELRKGKAVQVFDRNLNW